MLTQVVSAREALPPEVRRRVHIASLPMDDPEENAAIVNALQTRADVVVQKSLAEGFGLTVAEAMWKGRPVVASAVGGIQDQVIDGITGLLVDPRDLDASAAAWSASSRTASLPAGSETRRASASVTPSSSRAHLRQWFEVVQRVSAATAPAEQPPLLTDLHCHLLPGVDDGPATIDDALGMARQAAADGIAVVCATPHIRHDHDVRIEQLGIRVAELGAAVAAAGVPVKVTTGGEVAEPLIASLNDGELRAVSLGGGGRWLLVEPRPGPLGDDLQRAVRALDDRGSAP